MAILNNNPLVGASGNQGGYNINNSLRFRSSASAYLSRTPASAGNRTTWTWSGWIKRGSLSSLQMILSAGTSGSPAGLVVLQFSASDTLQFVVDTGTTSYQLNTTQVFRDPSAWYHIVAVLDTTQATSANRMKLYVNGSQITAFGTATYPAQNDTYAINNTQSHNIARYYFDGTRFFDGYLSEVNFIDGQALTPSSFGSTNATTGVWQPAKYTGTYGTNGFYLKFSDIATTSGSNAGLGKDFSGNTNYWTTNNISVTSGTTYDAMTDSPTNTSATVANYAVLNPLDVNAVTSITEANLYSSLSASASAIVRSTIAITSGKWYWEVKFGTTGDTLMVGVCDATTALTNSLWSTTNAWMYYSNNGNKYNSSSSAYGATFTNGDIIGVALDMDAGTLVFYKNNVSQGTAYNTGLTGKTLTPTIQSAARALTAYINFGQRPFEYTPPTGYVALNTYNLPTPTILQGNKYMDATLYTGNGTVSGVSQTITNASAFKPDFVWVKSRSNAYQNALQDSVRGAGKTLFSALTNAEAGNSGDLITSFNSNGFTVNTTYLGGFNETTNNSGSTYVGWQWQAGQGSTSSNTSGSITSTVSVNTTAGFSVVTWTGNGTVGATVGHSLGVAPKMVIMKRRNGATNWQVWITGFNATTFLFLQSTNAVSTAENYFNSTLPSSTLLTLSANSEVNASGGTYVAYCWAAISGFSAFGSYTGNGSSDGPFIATNFAPKYVMIKQTNTTGDWQIFDTSRSPTNVASNTLYANGSFAEDSNVTNRSVDFLSNGFKIRSSGTFINASGGTFIYAAFAENPFKNSLAR